MIFPLICHLQAEFPVSVMCDVLKVSRSGYYAWLRRPESKRKAEDKALSEVIKEIHKDSNGEYGSPKIHQELRRRGTRCGHNRVARLMRKDGLKAKTIRKFKATTNSDHNLPVAENLLNRDFSPAAPNRPGSLISRTSGRMKAGSTWRSSSTSSHGPSLDGPCRSA